MSDLLVNAGKIITTKKEIKNKGIKITDDKRHKNKNIKKREEIKEKRIYNKALQGSHASRLLFGLLMFFIIQLVYSFQKSSRACPPELCVIHKNIQTKGGNLNGIKKM